MQILEKLGAIAGIAGICVGAFVLIFRDVIRKAIFPKVTPTHGYKLIRLILILTWSIAVIGILVWAFAPNKQGLQTKAGRTDTIPTEELKPVPDSPKSSK